MTTTLAHWKGKMRPVTFHEAPSSQILQDALGVEAGRMALRH